MEATSPWLLLLIILLSLISLLFLLTKTKNENRSRRRLPPGPPAIPFFGNLFLVRKSMSNLHAMVHDLHAKYGPIISVRLGSRLLIFISDQHLTHSALITHGATFASRPLQTSIVEILTAKYHTIASTAYCSLWRLLRRNLAGEFLHPSRVKLLSSARKWTSDLLKEKLSCGDINSADGELIIDKLRLAIFSLLVYMCFGKRLDERYVEAITSAQRNYLLHARKLDVFTFMPRVTKYLYRNRWNTMLNLRKKQKDLFMPLIGARRELKEKRGGGESKRKEENILEYSYVDTLLDTRLPDEGRRSLMDDELVALCSEFLNAGTDTTSTALQWIMAELVKNKQVQSKLWQEIRSVLVENGTEEINEEMLGKMPYLKAVVLEALRLHPPAYNVLYHAVTEETTFAGYFIPKNAWINFSLIDIGLDKEIWKNPNEFNPERFLEGGEGEGVDVTGTREMKMIPFGAGRRICAGIGVAMLHLEYFVANLVKEFEWREIEGEEVDFDVKLEFTAVMKKPLRAQLVPRE